MKMEENAWQMEEMRNMIEEMTRAQKEPLTHGVRIFQLLICLISHQWYISNFTFMSFVGLKFLEFGATAMF